MSCSIIHCNFSRCICFSPASERLAEEDGCNSGYCFSASESFVSKISIFSNMMFCWFMSWSSSIQVYNRFTRDFWGYCARIFFLKTRPQSENLTYHPWSFFLCPASKKTYCFQLFHCLKFTEYLLKLNKCKRLFRI